MAEAARRESGYAAHPDYDVHFEPCPRRVRVMFGGETVADSTQVQYLFETRHLPVYYFPREDVRMDLMRPTQHSTFCPFKGEASYWTVEAGGKAAENAVWSYEAPFPQTAEIKDYLAFYWDRMEHWYEEDEEVFVHPRNPYVRVDVLDSSRPVRIELGGETVAESRRSRFLFETGLPTRYYLPREDVRTELLVDSERTSRCPYKGTARYWHVEVGGERFEDVVWSYPEPLAEAARVKDYLCFFDEKVDAVHVDGKAMARPKTKWSKR
ncbi:MAG TPA: DUF427 domain-containing protein [Alphaproteobacteria bacterium]|nr:DUF427 domain-containing protein [Alphaproteobacteria bacterium]